MKKKDLLNFLRERQISDALKSIPMFQDDITFCCRKCSNKKCMRNQENMVEKRGLHSFSDFYDKEKCPEDAISPDWWKNK